MSWRDGRTRSVCKKIMFTPEEWRELNAVYHRVKPGKGYRSFNEFARDLLFHGVVITISVPITPDDAKSEISKIGTNINQIAKVLNASGSASAQQISQIQAHLASIKTLVKAFQDEVAVQVDEVR